ncbi:hypothetical protein RhiirA5_409573 [Rhizophagus irregularis]|uniref:Uncharacterized protein n=1 Tax=Rhizophagus irregularis TaxID=588596 RepID=A0A2N0Q5B8_9GLOM|nr:hypothetical protein RhiirA5_409573 [Rhizophagus irregularis]
MVHGISMNEKGCWSDLACIGGNYKDAFREKVDGEIARQSMKRKLRRIQRSQS